MVPLSVSTTLGPISRRFLGSLVWYRLAGYQVGLKWLSAERLVYFTLIRGSSFYAHLERGYSTGADSEMSNT